MKVSDKGKKFSKFNLQLPIHPFVLSVFPVLFLYTHNINELLLISIIRPLLTVVGITILVYIFLNLLLKNPNKTALLVSIYLLIFFTYGHVKNLVGDFDIRILSLSIGFDKSAFVIWPILFLLSAYFVSRAKTKLTRFTSFLNISSIFLILISVINISLFELDSKRLLNSLTKNPDQKEESFIKLIKPNKPPDIYYLVFDRYVSKNTLENYYGYDTSGFFGYLEKQGFYIANNSHANYPATFLSLSSSLNMEYVNYFSELVGESSNERTKVYETIQNNKVQDSLKRMGYKYIHVGSWWNPTRVNKNADVNFVLKPEGIGYLNLDEFSTKLVETTFLPPILNILFPQEQIEPIYERNNHRNMINYGFDSLELIPKKFSSPKFVFAHILMPHAPYVLDQHCDPITKKQVGKLSDLENYLNQLECGNKKITAVIDKIFSESEGKAIIILQADEGQPIKFPLAKKRQESSPEALNEKTSILNAIYLPGKNSKNFYSTMTPVNTFRNIFNLYFGADFKLLDDKIYFFEDSNHPYKLYDVTERIKD